jgi:hypothetical protein
MNDNGVVKASPDDREGYWFSDGYGDYIVHFLEGIASVPEWADAQTPHILRSSSVAKSVREGPNELHYEMAEDSGIEEILLPAKLKSIEGGAIVGEKAKPLGAKWLRVTRTKSKNVVIRW